MLKSSIGHTREVNHVLLDKFKIQGEVKMYSQLPDYDDFRRFYLPNETDLTAISGRIYEGFAKP